MTRHICARSSPDVVTVENRLIDAGVLQVGEFADGIFVLDIRLGCAWRMVVMDSPKIRSTPEDQSATQKTCSPLSAGEQWSTQTLTPAERRERSGR